MASSAGFLAFLDEQLAGIGPVSIRRMFGGAGVFADGIMFALVSDDTLYFKVDETTRADFEAEGMGAFTYATKDGRNTLMSYWRAPERLFDEPDEMLAWARKALTIARSADARKAAKASKRRLARAPKLVKPLIEAVLGLRVLETRTHAAGQHICDRLAEVEAVPEIAGVRGPRRRAHEVQCRSAALADNVGNDRLARVGCDLSGIRRQVCRHEDGQQARRVGASAQRRIQQGCRRKG